MEIIRGSNELDRTWKRPVLTIGNFDGVHLGHQQIIRTTVEQARKRKGSALAFTFRPHPQAALRPEIELQLLTTYDEKLELLGTLGLDAVIEEPFSRAFSTISPQDFFNEIVLKRIGAEAVVVGYDFAFGRERQGHLEVLEKLCKESGVELTIVPARKIGGEVASSSRIRRHLLTGDMEAAARLLGREFSYRGIVIKGEGRGRKLGFPTANLKLENKLALPYGVYATWALCESLNIGEFSSGKFAGGKKMPSVTNVGVRPTFSSIEPPEHGFPALVETHVLDQTFDLYGRVFEVAFAARLREERKFSGVEALKEQIRADAESARKILSRSGSKPKK